MRFESTFDLLNKFFDGCCIEKDVAKTDIYEDDQDLH